MWHSLLSSLDMILMQLAEEDVWTQVDTLRIVHIHWQFKFVTNYEEDIYINLGYRTRCELYA